MQDLEEKMLKIKNGEIINPFEIEIHLTNICNHDCKWCIYRDIRQHNNISMPLDKVMNLLKSLRDAGCESLLFSGGGEPLIHKNAEEIICFANSLGMNISLITNGGLLNKVNLKKLAHSVSLIRISMDSYDDSSYKSIHRPQHVNDTFTELCKNIKKLVQVKEKNTGIILSYILDGDSINGLDAFYEIAAKLGVDGIDIKTNHYLNYTKKVEYIHRANEIIREKESNGLTISYDPVKRRSNFIKDYWYGLCYQCVIEADGNIYPCCHTIQDAFIIGNIYEENFNIIWYGNKHKQLIREFYNNKLSCPVCLDSSSTKMISNIIRNLF